MPVTMTHDDGSVSGACDSCAAQTALYCVDGDYSPPWVCFDCYRAHNDASPPGRYGYFDAFQAEMAEGDVPPDEFEHGAENPVETVETQQEAADTSSDYEVRDSPMRLPVLEDRRPRLISFEQEVGRGGELIADRMYAAGFSESPSIHGYHSSRVVGGFVHVEEDGSVDAEVIYNRMRLDSQDGALRFERALNVVREAIREGESKLDMRCGGHVHVDIGSSALGSDQRYGMADVESLYHLWNSLEDVIYRLASANWSRHRTEVASTNYAPRMDKHLATDGRARLGSRLDANRSVLNFSNYLAARASCRCGAFTFEDWASCVCELPKATVEFRVFNATANLRKVHAYTALCLALVEYAKRHTVTTETHPERGWTHGAPPNHETAREALRFILWELPLTHEERQDIRYCAENSSLRDVLRELPQQRRPRHSREVTTA